jgi:hypothetical protein
MAGVLGIGAMPEAIEIAVRQNQRRVAQATRGTPRGEVFKPLKYGKTGAGEGIRTLDPNLGNLPVYLFDTFRYYAISLFSHNLLKTFLT